LVPRWSGSGQIATELPSDRLATAGLGIRSSTGLVLAGASDLVGPPLLASGPRSGLTPTRSPFEALNPQFAVGHLKSRKVDSFGTFGDFVTALTTELNGTNEALQVLADGPYDATTGVFSADQMVVLTND